MRILGKLTNTDYLSYLTLAILVLLPVSTPLVVAASQHVSIFVVSAWKELLLLVATPFAIAIFIRDKKLRDQLLEQRIVKLVLSMLTIYAIWTVFTWSGVESAAGFAAGTRYLYAYLLAVILGFRYPEVWHKILSLICIISVFVAIFGIAQALILPKDILIHAGYDMPGTDTRGVPPAYHLVAGNEEYVRAQSTLRGPNVLGAYMILSIVILSYIWINTRKKLVLVGMFICVLALVFSFSRSAYIGALISGVLLVASQLSERNRRKYLNWRLLAVVLVITGSVSLVLGKTDIIQTVVFHSSNGEKSISNEGHKDSLIDGLNEVISHPIGGGVGTAGPASVLNGQSKISENYFIQIGQEVGWIGLTIFVLLCIELSLFFYLHRTHSVAPIILYSFIGLNITAMLLHTWADEVIAITWWVMAGVATGVILNEKRKQYAPYRKNTVKEKPGQRS